MQQNAVRLGYFLAISLLLSALLYFFASNWPALDRWGKIGVSASVLLLFYLFAYVGSLVLKKHSFISNWLLVAGGLAFGISVALLGQIYNSHADSYMLFVVWLIPNLLFAIVTRYQPFYVISYVLAHLAVCFFLDPSVIHVTRDSQWWFMVFWLIALGNIVLFWLTSTERLKSSQIYYLSFFVFQFSLFLSSFVDVYGPLPELLYVVIGVALFFTFLRWMPNRALLVVTSTLLALFLLGKFFWFMLEYGSEGFFLVALLVAAGIVWGAVEGIKWLRKQSSQKESKWVRFVQEAFTVLVTLVAASIGAISLSGFLFLLFEDDTVVYFLYFLSLIGFLLPVILAKKMNTTVFYTILTMGYMIGIASSIYLEGYYWGVFLLALGYVWIASGSIPTRLLTQFTFLLVLYVKLSDWGHEEWVLWLLFVFQMAMYLLPRLPNALQNSSLVYALLSLLFLTETTTWGMAYNIAINLVYFAITTYLVYRNLHRKERASFGIALGFWFAFLLMKYYDFFWSLLHKSLSLLLLSMVFFVVSYWLDRSGRGQWEDTQPPLFTKKQLTLLAIILLQFVMVGYQIWSNESILSQGRSVKLELAPIDPRSLLQGDYVRLNYTISTLNNEHIPDADGKIRVVLRPHQNGVYGYSGFYEQDGVWNKTYQPQADDVILNGHAIGSDRVEYGIESYFVPEGTGREVERTAKFAQIRVGKKGDAILQELSAQ
ncbi:GDYXXLXY domain-containing protein [Brevibacillus choshinensis]|uniref:GDYXXLXY domain-containing protein n=1 Tax=Brevibacillus choshinensis TaxID=54911 RepID=UPI002E1C6476|nr:GDYXXLXY domain-containing protein [Brevibacillus choshinensis]